MAYSPLISSLKDKKLTPEKILEILKRISTEGRKRADEHFEELIKKGNTELEAINMMQIIEKLLTLSCIMFDKEPEIIELFMKIREERETLIKSIHEELK